MALRAWFGQFSRTQRLLIIATAGVVTAVLAVVLPRAWRVPEPPPETAEPTGTEPAPTPPSPEANRLLPDGVLARFGTHISAPEGRNPVFSSDGKRLAVLNYDKAYVFDIATSSELFSVQINLTNVMRSPGMGARFSADGLVAFCYDYQDKPALVWRIAPDGTHTSYPLAGGREASAFSISDDGTRLAVNWSGKVEVYDTTAGKVITPAKSHPVWRAANRNSGVALSHDGRLLAIATGLQIQVLSVESGDEVDSWEFPNPRPVLAPQVTFNRDGTRALVTRRSGSLNSPGAAQIRDLGAKTSTDVPKDVGEPLGSTAFSPSGELVAIVPVWESRQPVVLWSATEKKVVQRLTNTARCYSAAFSPDGKTLAIPDNLGVIGLWEVASGKLAPGSSDPPNVVRQLRYLDDGRRLAAFAGRWIEWELSSGRRVDRLAGAGRLPELSPDGKFAAHLDGNQLALLDAETGKEQSSARLDFADRFTGVRFSPDGTRLVTRTYETVRVWNVAAGQQGTSFPVLPGQYLLAVSPGAKQVAVGYLHPEVQGRSSDGREFNTVPAVYETATGKKLWDGGSLVSESYPSMFSPDGRLFAYEVQTNFEHGGGPTGVVVRETATGKIVWQTEGRVAAYSMAFSPDSRLLVLGQRKGEITVHETGTGKVVGTFGHKSTVTALTFSPTGKALAAASADASVFVWDMDPVQARLAKDVP